MDQPSHYQIIPSETGLDPKIHRMKREEGSLGFCFFCLVMMIMVSEMVITGDSRTHLGDIQALKEFKHGLNPDSIGPGSCLSSWDFSVDPCDHLFSDRFTCGFRCDRLVAGLSRVTEISLDQAGYSGSLSSSSWNLPFLQFLDLSDNSFSASIPDSFSNLTRLRRLALSRNSFSGKIPTSLCSLPNLEELYLDNNQLHGPIPASINGLKSLKTLELQENVISGEFPDLSSLKSLNFLDVSCNNISGQFTNSLPASLVELSIRSNKLEGNLPDSLGSLKFLQVMDLSHNNLSGAISWIVFDHSSLQQLTLSHNNFSWVQAPSNNGVSSELIAVDLSYNQLGGLLPEFMASMPKLSAVSLEHNKFTGMIPSQYALKTVVGGGGGTASFERLLLGGNYLFGPIPGPLMFLKPGYANVSLVDNCLLRCPINFFFCQGGNQKSLVDCKNFRHWIP